jgi:formylglycine-generating enzyme required for sulfatase activity
MGIAGERGATLSTKIAATLSTGWFIALASCQRVAGFEEFSGPQARGDSAAMSGHAGSSNPADAEGCTLPPQVTEQGPSMVSFKSSTKGCRWIDATEITEDQYQQFLADNPKTNVQADFCKWNADFMPSQPCMADPGIASNSAPDSPVVCIDECDAEAFCAWTGKRLCQGDWGGAALDDPARSEWYDACSSGGAREYPYGNDYEPGACNDAERPATGCVQVEACTTTTAGTLTSCVTPYGAFDLTGNVAEWAAECGSIQGMTDNCHVRGGGVDTRSSAATCKVAGDRARSYVSKTLGFRCCAG